MFSLAEWIDRGGRGQRRAAQSAQLQLWALPMVLSLFLVMIVLMLTVLCVTFSSSYARGGRARTAFRKTNDAVKANGVGG